MILTRIVRVAAASLIAFEAMSVVTTPVALAQQANSTQSNSVQMVRGSGQQITLTVGKGGLFQTTAPYAKVSVTDEKIVEVTPQSDREFILNPRGLGTTNVFVFDEKAKLLTSIDVHVVSLQKTPERNSLGVVRIYSRLYDAHGPVGPALYQCDRKNCESASEALNLSPSATENSTPGPKGAAPTGSDSQPGN